MRDNPGAGDQSSHRHVPGYAPAVEILLVEPLAVLHQSTAASRRLSQPRVEVGDDVAGSSSPHLAASRLLAASSCPSVRTWFSGRGWLREPRVRRQVQRGADALDHRVNNAPAYRYVRRWIANSESSSTRRDRSWPSPRRWVEAVNHIRQRQMPHRHRPITPRAHGRMRERVRADRSPARTPPAAKRRAAPARSDAHITPNALRPEDTTPRGGSIGRRPHVR